jgi:hypothetical protein
MYYTAVLITRCIIFQSAGIFTCPAYYPGQYPSSNPVEYTEFNLINKYESKLLNNYRKHSYSKKPQLCQVSVIPEAYTDQSQEQQKLLSALLKTMYFKWYGTPNDQAW